MHPEHGCGVLSPPRWAPVLLWGWAVWGAGAAGRPGQELPAQGRILELKTFQELTLNQIK